MDIATPTEWLKQPKYRRFTIMDADGWRDIPFDTEISEEEFAERLYQCTVTIAPK